MVLVHANMLNLTTRMAHRSIMEEIQSWETELEELIRNGHLKCLDQSTNQDLTEMSHRHGGLLPQGTRESVFYSKYSSKWQQARQHILLIEHILVREHILERIYSKYSSGPAQWAIICTLGFFDSCFGMLTDDAADAQEASTSIKEMKRLEDAQDASERVNPYQEARTAAAEQGPSSAPFASLFNLIPNVLALNEGQEEGRAEAQADTSGPRGLRLEGLFAGPSLPVDKARENLIGADLWGVGKLGGEVKGKDARGGHGEARQRRAGGQAETASGVSVAREVR
jgi:hypothetical protein